MTYRTVVEKAVQPPWHLREQARQPVAGTPTGARRSQIPWAILQVPPHDVRRDEPPSEQRGEPRPKASLPELGEHQRDIVVLAGVRAGDAKRAIQRFFHETSGFRFVGQRKSGVDVGFQRKFSKE